MKNKKTYLLIIIIFVMSFAMSFSLTKADDYKIKKNQDTNYMNIYINLSNDNVLSFLGIAENAGVNKIQYRTYDDKIINNQLSQVTNVYEVVFSKDKKINFNNYFDKEIIYKYHSFNELNYNDISNYLIISGSSNNLNYFITQLNEKNFTFQVQPNNNYITLLTEFDANKFIILVIIFLAIAITYINISFSSIEKAVMIINGYNRKEISSMYTISFLKIVGSFSSIFIILSSIFFKLYNNLYLVEVFFKYFIIIYGFLILIVTFFIYLTLYLHNISDIISAIKKKTISTGNSIFLIYLQKTVIMTMIVFFTASLISDMNTKTTYDKIISNNLQSNFYRLMESGNNIFSETEEKNNSNYIDNLIGKNSFIFKRSENSYFFVNSNSLKKFGIYQKDINVYYLNNKNKDDDVLNFINSQIDVQNEIYSLDQNKMTSIKLKNISEKYLDVSSIILLDESNSYYMKQVNNAILINVDSLDLKSKVNIITLSDYFFSKDILGGKVISNINNNTNKSILGVQPIVGDLLVSQEELSKDISYSAMLVFCLVIIEMSIMIIIYDYHFNKNREYIVLKFLIGSKNKWFMKYLVYNALLSALILGLLNFYSNLPVQISFIVFLVIIFLELSIYIVFLNRIKKRVLNILKGDEL